MTTNEVLEQPADAVADPAGAGAVEVADEVRRRHRRACTVGGFLAAIVFVAMYARNNGGVFAASTFSGFYETQARAFRDLQWDVPLSRLGIEAFRTGDKYYMYFGPWPSVFRLPLMAIFPGMDGKWTLPAMLTALAIGLSAVSSLGWRVRVMVRGANTAMTRGEELAVGSFVFSVGAGSVWLFLTSQAWVYHEAEIWGASLALAGLAALAAFAAEPRGRTLALVGLFATLAILSRPSVGFGPIAATVLLGGAAVIPPLARWFGVTDAGRLRRFLPGMVAAAVVPALSYIYVNYAKFESFLTFPSNRQVFSTVSAYRREMLAQNNDTLFGFKFAPTAAIQYFRPDALRFQELVPFVNFPRTAPVVGDDVLFDTIEPTSSVPSSMPLLALMAAVGIVVLLLARRGAPLRAMRIPLLGAIAGAVTVIPYSYIGQRYMSDFVPVLAVAGLVGVHTLLSWASGTTRRMRAVVATVALLAVASSYVNASLSWVYHHESELNPEGTELTRYVDRQYEIHDRFPGGDPPALVQGEELPFPPLARGTTFVLGDCDGVYWSQGNTWEPSAKWYALARTSVTGEYRFRVRFGENEGSSVQPLVIRGEPGRLQTIAAFVQKSRVAFGFASEGHDDLPHGPQRENGFFVGPRFRYQPGRTYDLTVVMDPNNGAVTVTFADYVGFAFVQYELTTPQLAGYVFPTDEVAFGRNDVGAPTEETFNGTLRQLPDRRPAICETLGFPAGSAAAPR